MILSVSMAFHLASSTPINKAKSGKRARVGSNACPKCDIELGEEDPHISCSVCELNFCTKCANISSGLLLALKEDKSHNFKWTCNGCKQNFPCMTGLSAQLRNIEEKTQNKLQTIEKRMEDMRSEVGTKVKEEVETMKAGLIQEVQTNIRTSLQDDVRKELYEIEEQRQRALNLIIFNLPESSSKNSVERKSYDAKKIEELCTFIGANDLDIKVTFRLGNPKDGVNRPLKIVFNNKKHRKTVLDKASNIRKLPTTSEFSRCIVAKDLTMRQREENKKRREERKNKAIKPKNQTIDERLYNEETICERNDRIETVATIENINIQEKITLDTNASQQSQPLLCPIRQLDTTHSNDILSATLPLSVMEVSEIGDETVIGGIFSPVSSSTGANSSENSNLNN